MAFDLSVIEKYCYLSTQERERLLSPQQPIVLLQKKDGVTLPEEIAPGQNTIGVMLAYTPLHLLLLEPEAEFPDLLVMTSGNLSEEPIAYQDDDAALRLQTLADAYLTHNRPIHMRVDDSVTRVINNHPYIIRRARGYAPDPLLLSQKMPPILATGAELKNTFCLTKDRYAFISQHIGDLENHETLKSFEEGIQHYCRLFKIKPEIVACDLHPDYLATQYAQNLVRDNPDLKIISVQHHHAHLAACLADNLYNSSEPVIGLTFDGTGLGTDGHIWGGEVLLGNLSGFTRLYHLKYTALPGGSLAIHKPARLALSYLKTAGIDWDPVLPPVAYLCADERTVIHTQLNHHINSPLTSSMGRLFDAVSSLLGIRQVVTYEGQAAVEMEALIDPQELNYYEMNISADEIDTQPLFQQIISDQARGLSKAILSARFHNSIIHLSRQICCKIRQDYSINTVVLSGGVFQNNYLLSGTINTLASNGFNVLYHHHVPTNDGGISLGQAVIAASNFDKF
ncbi:MAG: carbamoyltransferase HypF, partial [Anaerolineae bacterium]|nr:carbamoyltransferase HypF [Anaerolineae bacterium]